MNAEIIIERLQQKDALLFHLSDTLDVKASIWLVVITFLATQTAGFLSDALLPGALRYAQIGSALSLAAAGALALVVLWPRNYYHENPIARDAS